MNETFRDYVDKVKAASPVENIIGRGMVTCPFHKGGSEKHPSLKVYQKTQSWYCFSCKTGGDIVNYVMLRDNRDFNDALRKLATDANILPLQFSKEDEKRWSEQRIIDEIMFTATAYYHKTLPEDIRQMQFIDHYGFTNETIDTFMLGFADGNLYKYLEGKFDDEDLLKTGLFIKIGEEIRDFYNNRLFFPYWKSGRVVYSIGRRIDGKTPNTTHERAKYKKQLTHGDKHKYVSELVRNDYFFNEDATKGNSEILVVEGITDCISALQAGIPCISPVTVKIKESSIPRFLNLTKDVSLVYICFDSEESGIGFKSAIEAAKTLEENGKIVYIVELSRPDDRDKIDLNEYLKYHKKEDFETLKEQALSLLDYEIKELRQSDKQRTIIKVKNYLAMLAKSNRVVDKNVLKDILVQRGLLSKREADRYINEFLGVNKAPVSMVTMVTPTDIVGNKNNQYILKNSNINENILNSDILGEVDNKITIIENSKDILNFLIGGICSDGNHSNHSDRNDIKAPIDVKVHEISPKHLQRLVRFPCEVSIENEDSIVSIPLDFICPNCSECVENIITCDEIVDRISGFKKTPACSNCSTNKVKYQMIPKNICKCLVYRYWVQHPAMQTVSFKQRKRNLQVFQLVDEPLVDSYGMLDITGIVVEIPFKKSGSELGILAHSCKPCESTIDSYDLSCSEDGEFKKAFGNITGDMIEGTIAPAIAGRGLVKEFLALAQHSPLYLPNGDFGLLKVLLGGDDTTGKTPICQDVHQALSPIGAEYADENTSVVGLTGGADRDPTGRWTITYGAFSRADGGLIILDGLHTFDLERLAHLREALKSKIIRIQKVAHAIRPARVRVIGTINTHTHTDALPVKYYSLFNLGLKASESLNRIDLSRWHIVLIISRNDISVDDIDKSKARAALRLQRIISADLWKRHVLWTWWMTSDPENTVITAELLCKITEVLKTWRITYPFVELHLFGPKGFDIFCSFVCASAYLHHRLAGDGKVHVARGDIAYIKDLFERYFNDLGLSEANLIIEDDFSVIGDIAIRMTDNQKKLVICMVEGPKSRTEIAKNLGVHESSVSRLLRQRREWDPETREEFYYGVDLVEGRHALIEFKHGRYALTAYGQRVAKEYLLSTPSRENCVSLSCEGSVDHDRNIKISNLLNTIRILQKESVTGLAGYGMVLGDARKKGIADVEYLIRNLIDQNIISEPDPGFLKVADEIILDKSISYDGINQEYKGTEPLNQKEQLCDSSFSYVILRFLEHVPAFLGTDGRSYTFSPEDVGTVPLLDAENLIHADVAVEIEVRGI